MRRSGRAAKARAQQAVRQSAADSGEEDDNDGGEVKGQRSDSEGEIEEDDEEEESLDGADSSADEWRPEVDARKGKRRRGGGGRRRVEEGASDEESDENDTVDEDDLEVLPAAAKKSKQKPKKKARVGMTPATPAPLVSSSSSRSQPPMSKPKPKQQQKRVSKAVEDAEILAAQAAIEAEEEAERLELEASKAEAAEAWKELRRRKEQQQQDKEGGLSQDSSGKGEGKKVAENETVKPSFAAAPASLTSWLGIPDPDWPTTCPDAMINDRDSLFVGYVYTLTTPSLSTISQLLSHLGKAVHPKTVPTDRLPPSMQHLPTNRRGATHDLHAWRCLALKVGRTGLNGPEDFGLEEGMDDDGEKYGAEKISRVIKQLGATDVLVVVSRWYGGTMLGPIRFQHIADCARAALSQYMIDEALVPLKDKLRALDERVKDLRLQLNPGLEATATTVIPSYDNLDLAKIERLINAREKGVEMLEKRLKAMKDSAETISSVPPPVIAAAATNTQDASAEEELAAENEEEIAAEPRPPTNAANVAPPQIAEGAPLIKDEDVDGADLTGWDVLE